MTDQLYEGMFLVDNETVRESWSAAKAAVTDVLTKHGAKIETARRWDERRLAYAIERRQRATYLLVHFTMDTQGIAPLRRDLELSELVLRYLLKNVVRIPDGESELSQAELSDDFVAPEPPPEVEEPEPEPEPEQKPRPRAEAPAAPAEGEAAPAEGAAAPAEGAAAPAEGDAAPAEGAATEEAKPAEASDTTKTADAPEAAATAETKSEA